MTDLKSQVNFNSSFFMIILPIKYKLFCMHTKHDIKR